MPDSTERAEELTIENGFGQRVTVTRAQYEAIERIEARPIEEATRAYLEADASTEPMVHVLGSLDAPWGCIKLAFTGGWDWAEGQYILWSLFNDLEIPEGVTKIIVHVGLPTLGAHTTVGGVEIDYQAPERRDTIYVPYGFNTEGGDTAMRTWSPCASVTREQFREHGMAAFYPNMQTACAQR